MNAAIRPAEPNDIPPVLQLWRDGDAEPTHTDRSEHLRRLIDHDPGALLVAETGIEIVGSVIAGWDGWRGSIYRLVVAAPYRRSGLGRQLLEAAENRLAAAGAVRSQAIVVATDDQACSFWRSTGWNEQADRLRFVSG
jgi:ribosomal protein S18 acetylase RimI-like enzyme